jgi:hypothetical protein
MNPYPPDNQDVDGNSFISIDEIGIPHVTPDPITTPDIGVCPTCGCMELTTPEHQAMFPSKEDASY